MKLNILCLLIILLLSIFNRNNKAYAQDKRVGNRVVKDYSNLTPKVNGNNIYKSEINKYRIKIPNGWKINKPNSVGTEFNAMDPLEIASMEIAISTFDSKPKSFSIYDMSPNEIIEGLKQKYNTVKLLESKNTYLSNEEALYIKYKFNYKTLDLDLNIITYQYLLLKGLKYYVITYKVNEEFEKPYKKIIEDSLLSFTFEN